MQRLIVGAHVVVYVNGSMYGRVASISYDVAEAQREVSCIDMPHIAELVPTTMKINGNLTIYRLHADGGIEGAGMAPVWQDLPRAKYFSILIVDRYNDQVLFRSDKNMVQRQSWTVGRGFVMGSVAFTGITWSNEVSPSV